METGSHLIVPTKTVILLSGIPATGKSTFACHLVHEHGFAHYDLEDHPSGWRHQDLHASWARSRSAFISEARQRDDGIVLDWGFPVGFVGWIRELQAEGVRLIWFSGDIAQARLNYEARARNDARKNNVADFDGQVCNIQKAGFPASLNCVLVPALGPDGISMTPAQIESIVFATGPS
jgi:hypothetical protein